MGISILPKTGTVKFLVTVHTVLIIEMQILQIEILKVTNFFPIVNYKLNQI